MDKITLERIENAHPELRKKLKEDYLFINNKLLGKGVRLRFSHVYRSFSEQNKLFNKRPRVTYAKGEQSYHNYGLAFDIVLLYDNDKNGTFEKASWNTLIDGDSDGVSDWLEVTREFENRGWKNGFLRNGKKWDLPHFQIDFGYHWRDLLKKINKGGYIIDNGIKYPKL